MINQDEILDYFYVHHTKEALTAKSCDSPDHEHI